MALPEFPTASTVGQLETINGITWRVRSLVPAMWEPLAFNVQNYWVSPEMFGAVGNGAADDTAAVQACLSSNKVKVFRPNATYLVTARLNINAQQDTALYGNGARILRNQTDGMYPGQPSNPNTGYANPGIDQHILVLKNCKNVLIDGLRIRGGYNPSNPQIAGINTTYWSNSQTNGRGEDGHGISISSCEDIICRNNEIVNVWGDAFWLQSGGYLGDLSSLPNINIHIHDNDIRNPFRGCLSSVHHINLRFENNYCEKYTGYTTAVLIEPNNNAPQNCVYTTVANNQISCGLSGVFAATAAGALLNGEFCRHIHIYNNTCSASAFCAINIPGTTDVVIEHNTYYNSGLIDNANQYGLFLEASLTTNIKVINNTDFSGGTSVNYFRGVRIESCGNVTFEKHTIEPLYSKTNVEYFQIINTSRFRLIDSEIKGRDTTDPNGTSIVSMYGTSSQCSVRNNKFNGLGTTQGVVYLEQSTYTGTQNEFLDNIVTTSASSNAVSLKTNHFGTTVGANIYTSGRVSNVAGGDPRCYAHPTALIASIVYSYGTALPTTGTAVLGSRVYNVGAGPTDYWECTTAGSPGTWTARN